MGSNSVWEIEEEVSNNNESNNGGIEKSCYMNGGGNCSSSCSSSSMINGKGGGGGDEDVYVAVCKKRSSMDALTWALKHLVIKPSTFVYLIHVFPEIHHVPTPLGLVPKSHVSAQQVETYMGQQRIKRREMLQKFMDLCNAYKVQVDTLLIESDIIAKAVTDLIAVLNIKRLIVGTSKSNMRKFKGNSKAEQIQKSAPQYCEVTIICDGKQLKDDIDHKEKSSSSSQIISEKNKKDGRKKTKSLTSWSCFRRKSL